MGSFKLDFSYAIRSFRRSPGFTIVTILTLALGIGATSAIFSVMNAAMLRPLPFPDPDRVVAVYEVHTQEGFRIAPSRTTRRAWNEESELIEGVGTYGPITEFTLSGQRVYFNRVDLDAFRVLGVAPLLGRWYEPDEVMVAGTAQTIIISYELWQRQFGGDPNIIGLLLPDWTAEWGRTVIGVMPPGFRIAPGLIDADAWHAMESTPSPVGRVKPGVSLERAQAELQAIVTGVRRELGDPAEAANWRVELVPFQEDVSAGYTRTLFLLLGAVAFVLLIACANVVNLQLSRAVSRQTEMVTRAALGAGRLRLIRQLLTENVLLALLGGGLGIVVAVLGMRVFIALAPNFYPPTDEIRLDSMVLLFTFGVSVFVGLLFGLVPAMGTSSPNLHTALKQSSRGTTGGGRRLLRRSLVVSEVALALVLLIGAGLMINSYMRVMAVDAGFDPDDVMMMELNLRGHDRYRILHDAFSNYEVLPAADRLYTGILNELAALPEVEMAGLTHQLPPNPGFGFSVGIVGHPEVENAGARYQEISPDFFRTLGIPLLRGRFFTDLDRDDSSGVAIVNETAARQSFSGDEPLGQLVQIRIGDDRVREVVGVVQDIRTRLQNDPEPVIYVPYLQHIWHYPNATIALANVHREFVVRTSGQGTAGLDAAMRNAVSDVDPSVAVGTIMPMPEWMSMSAAGERFFMRLLGTFAGLGVFLAAIGIYGVIAYSVVQRTNEFGIRTALGAQRSSIVALVVREGLLITLIGLGIGVGAAFGLTRLIANQLFGVTPMDPVTITAVSMVLIGVALLACYVPAVRAARADPMAALRVE